MNAQLSTSSDQQPIKKKNRKKKPTRVDCPYYKHKNYMMDRYGVPMFRVPIDLGFGCPHRNADGSGGCTFCYEDGGRAEQTLVANSVEEQISGGIEFARSRYSATKFMAYIQAFTGTFASASEQRKVYEKLLDQYPFDAVSIGTRPDCLPPATLEFLQELSQRLEVWVELGVQTTHDRTLKRINRGHDWESSRAAIIKLHDMGIMVAVHLMVGLPGESLDDNIATAETIAALPIDGIKIHNLHIMRGTELAREFEKEPFTLYAEDEYAEIVIEMLRRFPPDVAIMRINTDTPANRLIAPHWQMSKPAFLNYVANSMKKRNILQGDLYQAGGSGVIPTKI